jgi:hypothetical protein
VEWLWYGVVVTFLLGSVLYFGLSSRKLQCPDCRTLGLMQWREIPESSPPVFEVVYYCPSCREVLWKHFVSVHSD